MNKEEIFDFLGEWFDKGYFTTPTKARADEGRSEVHVVESLCVARKLSYTSMPKVLFVGDRTNNPIWELFQKFCDEKRLMTLLEAKVQLNLPSLHRVHKAVERGELLRFEYHDAIIYVR